MKPISEEEWTILAGVALTVARNRLRRSLQLGKNEIRTAADYIDSVLEQKPQEIPK